MSDQAEPRWDIDYAAGRQAEMWVSDLRSALEQGTVEVKRDRRWIDTGNIYVEYKCKRRGEYRDSGIATTEADLWLFVLIEGVFAIVISTESLKALAREVGRDPRRLKEETDGSHPTKGVIISLQQMICAIRDGAT